MVLTGKQKAAMLLMSLDPATAADLLRSADQKVLTEIAAELAYLESIGADKAQAAKATAQEFFGKLGSGGGGEGVFVRNMLEQVLGKDKSKEALTKVRAMVQQRDPFSAVRSAETADIFRAISGESAQVVAIVLGELPAKKSAALLNMLAEQLRIEVVGKLATGVSAPGEVRLRIAGTLRARLQASTAEGGAAGGEENLRKVAMLLRDLEAEPRNKTLEGIAQRDKETADAVSKLMVIWEDIPLVLSRSLQEGLRQAEARQLALAIRDADERIIAKIRENLSERAVAALDEEAELLSAPKQTEIAEAREAILQLLRDMNAAGNLRWEES